MFETDSVQERMNIIFLKCRENGKNEGSINGKKKGYER